MKFKQLSLLFLVVIIIVSLSGCKPKIWVYDFVEENSLVRGDEIWRPYSDSYYFDDGLILSQEVIGAPHYYTGDFSYSVVFDLDVSPGNTVQLSFFLCSSENILSFDWSGGAFIPFAGSTTAIMSLYYTTDMGVHYLHDAPVASLLNNSGRNTITIEKSGNILSFYLNESPVFFSMSILEYDEDRFCPYMSCFVNRANSAVFKMVKIEYKGEQILID